MNNKLIREIMKMYDVGYAFADWAVEISNGKNIKEVSEWINTNTEW